VASFDDGLTLADRMRSHAGDGEDLYAVLMRAMATDWEQGGPVREICRDWEDAPRGSVVQLRLLAGVFRLVLTGLAPELERFYPCLGGSEPPSEAWPVVRDVLAAHVDELRGALEVAPQTNEVGRSVALLVGLFEAVGQSGIHSVRLLEPGASAGLNLLVDRYRYAGDGWSFGPSASPLVLGGIVGSVEPQSFEVVDRRGCDLSPVDASSDDGRLRLRSFVWPFHVDRHERLAAALEVVEQTSPAHVDEAGAGEWLERQLGHPPDPGVLTVVWHSITRMYWPPTETDRVQTAIADAGRRFVIAHLAMEYPSLDDAHGAELTLDLLSPDDVVVPRTQRLALVADHGVPVTMLA
jgi:hypothetical protein